MTTAEFFRKMEMPNEGDIINHENANEVYITFSDVEFAQYLLEDRGDPTEAY